MDDNVKIALQAQLKELQEEGVFNAGYSYDIFKKLDTLWLLELVENEIQLGSIDKYIKTNDLQMIALQLCIDDLDWNDEDNLKEFRELYQYFNNLNTYNKVLKSFRIN